MKAKIVLLPGDGIGPEIIGATREVLEILAKKHGHTFEFESHLLGGAAIDATGTALPEETLTAARTADARGRARRRHRVKRHVDFLATLYFTWGAIFALVAIAGFALAAGAAAIASSSGPVRFGGMPACGRGSEGPDVSPGQGGCGSGDT